MKGIPVSIANQLIAQAESAQGIRAGIVRLGDVLKGPSYKISQSPVWSIGPSSRVLEKWIEGGSSVLVLGLNHPESNPRLDWFDRGNTAGNRMLMELIDMLIKWIQKAHGLRAQLLPYFLEQGGIFLKDAAVLAGLGIIGRNNLLISREWGPRIRLRAMLVAGDLRTTPSIDGFAPCEKCDAVCRKVCPQKAFSTGAYSRSACLDQLNINKENSVPSGDLDTEGNPIPAIQWCRECEFACPAGKQASQEVSALIRKVT